MGWPSKYRRLLPSLRTWVWSSRTTLWKEKANSWPGVFWSISPDRQPGHNVNNNLQSNGQNVSQELRSAHLRYAKITQPSGPSQSSKVSGSEPASSWSHHLSLSLSSCFRSHIAAPLDPISLSVLSSVSLKMSDLTKPCYILTPYNELKFVCFCYFKGRCTLPSDQCHFPHCLLSHQRQTLSWSNDFFYFFKSLR